MTDLPDRFLPPPRPAPPPPPPPPSRRAGRNTALIWLGVIGVLLIVGGLALIVATPALADVIIGSAFVVVGGNALIAMAAVIAVRRSQ